MKNQYFGDVNDFCKYALLRALSGQGELRTLVAWMLTPDDGGRDGGKLGYLKEPQRYRSIDPELFDFLLAAANGQHRGVELIQAGGLLPQARFYGEALGDEQAVRWGYFAGLAGRYPDADLVFFDPDNGMETPSCPRGRPGSRKYLYWPELVHAYRSGLSVLVYQHFPRVNREVILTRLTRRFREETGAAETIAFLTSDVALLLIPQADRLASFWRRAAILVQNAAPVIRVWAPSQLENEVTQSTRTPAPSPVPLPPTVQVITEVAGLGAKDVVHRSVLCPQCRSHTFKRWPLGWDGHAHRCAGLTSSEPASRKAEFRTQWSHLFR